MKECYYYLRDQENRPLVTVCLILYDGLLVRGVAICSPKDNACKAIGRAIAKGRALKALRWRSTTGTVRRPEPKNTLYKVALESGIFQFKSYFNSHYVTPFETKLLREEE